jgi:hypothetical protein
MDIEQIRVLKEKAEKDIRDILSNLQAKTGARVQNISMDTLVHRVDGIESNAHTQVITQIDINMEI